MFRGGSADAYAQARRRAVSDGELRRVAWAPEVETVFWLFPNDRKITRCRRGRYSSPLPDGVRGRVTRRELVAYAPEKTATVACLDSEGRALAYAKSRGRSPGRRDFRIYETVGAALGRLDPRLGLPSALAYWTNRRRCARTDPRSPDGGPYRRRGIDRSSASWHRGRRVSWSAASGAPPFDRFAGLHLAADAR